MNVFLVLPKKAVLILPHDRQLLIMLAKSSAVFGWDWHVRSAGHVLSQQHVLLRLSQCAALTMYIKYYKQHDAIAV